MVVATQNPSEHHGTYPLPESQLDRFLMRLRMGYPDAASERDPIERCGRHWHVLVPVRNGKSDRER
jgi:MoxR-like ATPase